MIRVMPAGVVKVAQEIRPIINARLLQKIEASVLQIPTIVPMSSYILLGGGMTGGGHNEVKFKAAILALSTSADWDEAKAEWDLDFVYVDSSDRACECEHSPIHQICVIKNRKNSASTEVGNVCVRRFLRLLSNRIFGVLKRLQADIQKSLNPVSLNLFRDRGVISYAEAEEYKAYWRKRTTLSDDQKKQKLDINERVLAYFIKEAAALIGKAQAAGIKVSTSQKLP